MPEERAAPLVGSVLHPSDFSVASLNAFAHALAMALQGKTRLTLLHAGRKSESDAAWRSFPRVRHMLERWGRLKAGSPKSAVFRQLRLRVEKVQVQERTPLQAILRFLEEKPTELIVLATEGREGLPRWIRPSVAEELARRTRTLTLFVPNACRGFVSVDDGSISLRRILLPIDHRPDPREPMVHAAQVAAMGSDDVEVVLLHVGPEAEMPRLEPPADTPACRWRQVAVGGNVVDEIVRAARGDDVDLIVMATEGHDGFLDALRGSVTEQVLRQADRPVLAVPAR